MSRPKKGHCLTLWRLGYPILTWLVTTCYWPKVNYDAINIWARINTKQAIRTLKRRSRQLSNASSKDKNKKHEDNEDNFDWKKYPFAQEVSCEVMLYIFSFPLFQGQYLHCHTVVMDKKNNILSYGIFCLMLLCTEYYVFCICVGFNYTWDRYYIMQYLCAFMQNPKFV